MKKLIVILSAVFFAAGIISAQAAKTKKATAKIVSPRDRIAILVTKESVAFNTSGYSYCVQSEGIYVANYMMYFTAKDETANKELLVQKVQKIEIKTDSPDIKKVDASFVLEDQKHTPDSNYRLDLQLEVIKGLPMLAVNSKFVYLGEGSHQCVINWGVSNTSSSQRNKFKYYARPGEKGKILTFRLAPKGTNSKIGYEKWICVNDGWGDGLGLICPSMLGKGDDFIFINSTPPEKELSANQSSDVFFLLMPIHRNVKIMNSLYSRIASIKFFE